MSYEPHPAARLLPPMGDEEFAALSSDIWERGLLEPIDRIGELILDGNNRYRACLAVGVEPRFVDWQGDDPIAYVLSKNLHRRHLTASQRAAAAVEAEALYADAARERRTANLPDQTGNVAPLDEPARALDQAAAATGASRRTAQDAKAVKTAAPHLFEKIKAGEVTVAEAKKTVRKAQDQADVERVDAANEALMKDPEHAAFVKAAQLRQNYADHAYKWSSYLGMLDPEKTAAVLEGPFHEGALQWVASVRRWLDGFEKALRSPLRVVQGGRQ